MVKFPSRGKCLFVSYVKDEGVWNPIRFPTGVAVRD